jgi:uncharacterized caspase-like protein
VRASKQIWLVLLALLLVGVSTIAEETTRGLLVESVKPGLTLSIDKGCGAVYEHDELLEITVRSDKSGYLTIFDFMPDGRAQIIYPNSYHEDNFIEGDKAYRIPGELLPFQFLVAPPDGEEIIYAVVMKEPYDLIPGQIYDFANIFPQLSGAGEVLARSLVRGIQVVGSENWLSVAMCHFYVGQGPSTALGDGWGLFIGVDDYDETRYTGADGERYYFPKLKYCVKGAQEMAEALQPLFPHQRLLMDREVTHESVRQAITGWLSKAPSEATVMIYFSGHGSRIPDENNDEIDGYDETIVPWNYGTQKQFIVDDELRRWLSLLNSDRVILIFDSCHSGTMERGVYTSRLVSTGTTRAVEPQLVDGIADDVASTKGSRTTWWKQLVITACRPNESAYESSRLENGALSYYLLRAMEGEGDFNGDGWVTAQEAYKYAADMVQLDYPKQHPQLTDNIKEAVLLSEVD